MALDFDDLEEEATARAEAGDDEAMKALGAAGWNVQYPGKWTGRLMLEMHRSKRIPGVMQLPEKVRKVRKQGGEDYAVRLFIFYGGGDSFVMWSPMLNNLPDWVDAGVHEFPGHGVRDEEELSKDLFDLSDDAWTGIEPILRQHAHGEKYENAPFALLGHSQGILQMIEVAERARRTFLLEPLAVFALDRPPPGPTGASREGYRLLTLDWPEEFYELQPPLCTMMKDPKQKDQPKVKKIVKMWQNDMRLSNELETQRPVGFHTFHCDVHVFIADQNWGMDRLYQGLKATGGEITPELEYQMQSQLKIHDSGEASYFNRAAYDLWDQWTDTKVHYTTLDVDHNNLKTHKDMWAIVIAVLKEGRERALKVTPFTQAGQ